MPLIQRLSEIVADYHLLKHPFYQAWEKGELSREDLQVYAIQYYDQVRDFPKFISRIHSRVPHFDGDMKVRKSLLGNLNDEEGEKDHPSLWRQFAEGLGVKPEQLTHTELFPETKQLIATFYDLADRDWRDGLCALYAYESQVPEVAHSKIAGLKKFYQINDERSLAFFVAHQVYDVEHTQEVSSLLEDHAEVGQAEVATETAAKALWQFLDGMCENRGIHC